MTGKEYFTLYERSRDKAYDALFEEYCNYVYAIVNNRLRGTASREDMEECVSDIFADVFFGFAEGISADGDMKGYIGTVAKRRSINAYHRLAAQQRHLSDSDEEKLGILKSDKDIEADSEVKDTTSILLSRINELGEPDSTILIQKFYYNRNSKEIAESVSMTASAVRQRCSRAMDKLRTKLVEVGLGR